MALWEPQAEKKMLLTCPFLAAVTTAMCARHPQCRGLGCQVIERSREGAARGDPWIQVEEAAVVPTSIKPGEIVLEPFQN